MLPDAVRKAAGLPSVSGCARRERSGRFGPVHVAWWTGCEHADGAALAAFAAHRGSRFLLHDVPFSCSKGVPDANLLVRCGLGARARRLMKDR